MSALPDWVVYRSIPSSEFYPEKHLDIRDTHELYIFDADTQEKFDYLASQELPPDFKLRLKFLQVDSTGIQKWVYGGSRTTLSPYCVVPVITTVKKYYIRGWSKNTHWPGSVKLQDLPQLLAQDTRENCPIEAQATEEESILEVMEPISNITLDEEPQPSSSNTTCIFKTTKGKNKGQGCNRPCITGSQYCSKCSKKKSIIKLLQSHPCSYQYKRGPKKGQTCGAPVLNGPYCKDCCKRKGAKTVMAESIID